MRWIGRSCPGWGRQRPAPAVPSVDCSFMQQFPDVIGALEVRSQICANPALEGAEPEEKGRCSPTSPSASLTDLVSNPGLMAPGLPLQWCQPPQFRVPK